VSPGGFPGSSVIARGFAMSKYEKSVNFDGRCGHTFGDITGKESHYMEVGVSYTEDDSSKIMQISFHPSDAMSSNMVLRVSSREDAAEMIEQMANNFSKMARLLKKEE